MCFTSTSVVSCQMLQQIFYLCLYYVHDASSLFSLSKLNLCLNLANCLLCRCCPFCPWTQQTGWPHWTKPDLLKASTTEFTDCFFTTWPPWKKGASPLPVLNAVCVDTEWSKMIVAVIVSQLFPFCQGDTWRCEHTHTCKAHASPPPSQLTSYLKARQVNIVIFQALFDAL